MKKQSRKKRKLKMQKEANYQKILDKKELKNRDPKKRKNTIEFSTSFVSRPSNKIFSSSFDDTLIILEAEKPNSKKKLFSNVISLIVAFALIYVIIFMSNNINDARYYDNYYDIPIIVNGEKHDVLAVVPKAEIIETISRMGYSEDNYTILSANSSSISLLSDNTYFITYSTNSWEEEKVVVRHYILDNILKNIGINLSKFDKVYVDGNLVLSSEYQTTTVKNNAKILIKVSKTEIIESFRKVGYKTETIQDDTLPKGTVVVEQKGIEGKEKTIWIDHYVDGIFVKREFYSKVMVETPRKEIIRIGNKQIDEEVPEVPNKEVEEE